MRGPILLVLLLAGVAHAGDDPSWRLTEALDAPGWLTVGIEQRSRVEHTDETFVANTDANPTALLLRTLLAGEARSGPAAFVLELQDGRAYADAEARLNTTHVDPLELLQAHVALRPTGLVVPGDRAELKLGRMTLDFGSRRLVARNRFRNTISAFTGFDTRWISPRRHEVRAFAVVPVARLPRTADGVRDNAVDLDREHVHALLWALGYTAPAIRGIVVELFALGFHERDAADDPSADRQLVMPGVRAVRPPAPGALDFQLEATLQLGTSRASAMASDDLDHRAYMLHGELGYRLELPAQPRVATLYDHASGDRDPADDRNQRFDPLFGARRMDFGPTGTYGPFARGNLSSPGARVEARPRARLRATATYRLYWLASIADAWGPAGIRDPDAGSRFLGHQLELRVRWNAIPNNLGVELGAARLWRGAFARTAMGGREAPATFAYVQLTTRL